MGQLGPEELAKLETISKLVEDLRDDIDGAGDTFGQKVADWVTRNIGAWRFILGQSAILLGWIAFNLIFRPFDAYPFILLNLVLSFQAAILMPVILMAQNRTDEKDRFHERKAQRAIGHIEQLVQVIAKMEGVEECPTDSQDNE